MSKKKLESTQQQELKGFGDVVEKVARKTGVKKIFDKLGIDCGCDKRQENLNKKFPFKHTPKCMTKDQYESFKPLVGNVKLNNKDRNTLANIHASLFNHKFYLPCNCSPKTWMRWLDEVTTVYSTYESK